MVSSFLMYIVYVSAAHDTLTQCFVSPHYQIGEWFYVNPGETIAIFSASHDKFVKISYEEAAKHDLRNTMEGLFKKWTALPSGSPTQKTAKTTAFKLLKPILIFRPFQTVSLRTTFCCVYTIPR